MSKKKLENESNLVITGKIDGEEKAMVLYNTTLQEAPSLFRSFSTNIFQDIATPNISMRDGFDRCDYDSVRPEERIPKDDKGKIIACMRVYEESGNGIIKNIVDLMADLVVQGIDVVHPKKKNEKFAKAWFNKTVQGTRFSERFVNTLCRAGNVIVKRDKSKISLQVVRKYYQGEASVDVQEETKVEKRDIPVRYMLLDVRAIEVFEEELSMFLDSSDMQFGLSIPPNIMRKVKNPSTALEEKLVNAIPIDIVSAIRVGTHLIPLDKDKVDAYYYKKDDWRVWATPMIYTVLSDVYALRKAKLADIACLDGALSQIRLWKLGSMDQGVMKIRPSLEAMNRLASTLMNAVPGGIMDLMWGPDIEMEESTSSLHNFLGDTKYTPILNSIYTGLGIPPLFTGVSASGSFTNNFLAIKTFIVRLEYLRNILRTFWDKELGLLSKALGWDVAPTLVFDRMTLNDEASILQIMLNMVDRGLLSDEAMVEMVGGIPEIESIRTKREFKERQAGKRPPKASPYPDHEKTWIDNFIKMGEVTPAQVGIELAPKKAGEKTPNESKVALGIEGPQAGPIGQGGRPLNKKDSIKRKAKTVKPQRGVGSLVKLASWSIDMQEKINEQLTPIYLQMLDKKNLRQLTDQETKDLERLKFSLLANLEPNSKLEENTLSKLMDTQKLEVPEFMDVLLGEMVSEYTKDNGEAPNIHQIRRMQSLCYSAHKIPEEDIDEEVDN